MRTGRRSAVAPARSGRGGLSLAFGLLLALVAAFPWDDALGYPTETISVVKLLGLAIGAAYLTTTVWRAPFVWPSTLPAVAIFLGVAAVSLLASGDVGSGTGPALRYLLFAGLFFLFVQIVRTRDQLVVVAGVLTASAAVAAAVGLIRFFTGAAERASGPIGEANDFAYVLATALPLGLYLLGRGGRARIAWFACIVVIGAGVLGTLSRGAIVGLVLAAVWSALRGRVRLRNVVAAVAVLAVLAGAALTFERPFVEDRLRAKSLVADDNIDSRVALWRGAIEMAEDHPVLGVGTGRYPVRAADYVVDDPLHLVEPVTHNAYLQILAENGVPGLLAFGAFVVGTWLVLRRTHRMAVAVAAGDEETARLASALQAAHIVAVVGAVFLSVAIAPPLWLVGAMAVVLRATVDQSEPAADRS